MNNLTTPKVPKRILGLNQLAFNLWWSWHPEARNLFKSLDRSLWKATTHNPVQLLQQVAPYRLVAAAEDIEFLKKYDSVMNSFSFSITENRYQNNFPDIKHKPIAYFSMEFALHNSLPLYAGGLGVLAGDYCKEASDLGVPLVGIGFMYPQGYFHQHIMEDGWQEEVHRQLNFGESPISPILDAQNQPVKIKMELDTRPVYLSVWQVDVGQAKLYLLDTNLEENCPEDRILSARLYDGDREKRLQQEIILGIGGVRVLRELHINPSIWHANEGHTSFMMLERCRELVDKGLSFAEARQQIQSTTVFTTHTPVPAGNDVFSHSLIEKYFHRCWSVFGLSREYFLELGTQPSENAVFNMTVLGFKMADQQNGVSQLHGAVCRKMWQSLWPSSNEKDIPICSITNGIHIPTWIAPQMAQLYERYLGDDWLARQDELSLWEQVLAIPDEKIWEARQWLKIKLIDALQDRARRRWRQDQRSPVQALAMGALLNPHALTIGFCRRFTDYKRAWLILKDIGRLKHIIRNELCPVQIVFSGKAHPNDHQGKCLIQQIYNIAKDPQFEGRIAYIEDYDLHMARYLVQGVDLWLNTPRPLQEASGTSGMKAALNGVPQLSVLDGWWYEAYNGSNGWAIHKGETSCNSTDQDKADADELYNLLENDIIPLYYDHDRNGIPHGWIQVIKEAIRSCAPSFSSRRMLKEYIEQMYLPAIQNSQGQ